MNLSQSLLPEFDQEMANTRKVLERVPEDKFAWKPHAKSFSMGALATHVATVPWWGQVTIEQESFDLAAPVPEEVRLAPATRGELLERCDRYVGKLRSALAIVLSDDQRHN